MTEEKPKTGTNGVTLKAGALYDAQEALATLARLPLARGSAYAVARMVKAMKPEIVTLDEQRLALVNEYLPEEVHGVPGHNVPPAKMPEFQKRWDEVRAKEITVSVPTMRLADLKTRAGVADVPAFVLVDLDAFILE